METIRQVTCILTDVPTFTRQIRGKSWRLENPGEDNEERSESERRH